MTAVLRRGDPRPPAAAFRPSEAPTYAPLPKVDPIPENVPPFLDHIIGPFLRTLGYSWPDMVNDADDPDGDIRRVRDACFYLCVHGASSYFTPHDIGLAFRRNRESVLRGAKRHDLRLEQLERSLDQLFGAKYR